MKIKTIISYSSGMKLYILAVIILFLSSCGTQNQLKKAWMSQPEAKLIESFGTPSSVTDREGDKIFIFEKQEELRSTEISQGKLALDPIMSPKVMKTERYIFTIREGIIIRTNFEEEYERY
jgi:hypothetical protein